MIKRPEMNMVIKQVVNFSALSLRSTPEDQNLTNALSKESEIKILAKTEILMMTAKVLYPLNVVPEKKKMITEHFCPEYPFTDLNLLVEMASDIGINLVVIDKG